MSTKPTPTHPESPRYFSTNLVARHRKQRGIAIITVLSVLLLMTVLILAFFKMAQSELVDAKLYSDGVRTRQLSEVVTNIVMGQIRQATLTLGRERTTWASQPGAITKFRNQYGNTEFANQVEGIFKLYSSNKMYVGYNPSKPLGVDVEGDWDEQPARYVDLNEPVYNSTQNRLYFPIIDPRGFASDVKGITDGNIEGFSYKDTNSLNREISGVVRPGQGGEVDSQRLPMPVEWMYMLADGSLGTVDSEGKWVPGADPSVRPTEKNPMVARLAFWTDDESSKININTASEGAFWGIPLVDSKEEREFGRYQPARNEVYRYPGHVAGVSLSTVLYPGSGGANNVGADPFLNRDQYQKILGLAPKAKFYDYGSGTGDREAVSDGGSQGGTTKYAPDSQRLYATVDEMLYAEKGASEDNPRRLNDIFENNAKTRNYFEYGRHSLTVNSNAPEITLHGTPRICMWPMKDVGQVPSSGAIVNNAKQTYFDRLISFAATLGTRRYYWQKNTPSSRHWELYSGARAENLELLEQYMYGLSDTQIPGYGSTVFRKYGSGDFEDGKEIMIQIWDYMRNTNLNDPLLPENQHYNSIASNYPPGGDQKLRSRVGRGQIAGSCLCGGSNPHVTRWYKKFSPYGRGHGRAYTLSEAAMVFYCRAVNPENGPPEGDIDAGATIDSGEKLIEVGLLLETFCVTHGFTAIQPKSRIVVGEPIEDGNIPWSREKLPQYKLVGGDGVEQPFPPLNNRKLPGVVARWDNEQNYRGKRGWGAHGGVRLFSADLEGANTPNLFTDPKSSQGLTDADSNNLLVWKAHMKRKDGSLELDRTNSLVLKTSDTTMKFIPDSNRELSIVLYDEGMGSRSTSVGNLMQMFVVSFDHPDPDMKGQPITLKVPDLDKDNRLFTWEARIKASGQDVTKLISKNHDVTRSVMVSHGDFRLISGRRVTNKQTWAPHPDFAKTGVRHAHTLTAADGTKLPGFNSNRGYALDESGDPIVYPGEVAPDFAGPTEIALTPGDPDSDLFFPRSRALKTLDYELSVDPGVTGDWDNGIGAHIDGPYINRPDDGTSNAGASTSGDPYFDNVDEIDTVERTFFSPNRVVGGPGQLGSLPTGIQAEVPWRTLLFRPDAEHFGAANFPRNGDIPDHVIMDFFWMPVVEPFPVSQPFATMGKVNMNYQIVPFDYINRATAVHAALKDQRMLAIENDAVNSYKKSSGSSNYRYPIDIPATLLQFEDRFEKGEVFRSATEICEIYMIPRKTGAPTDRNTLGTRQRATKGSKGWDYPPMREFWKGHALTGDNAKERVYADIYPRLTTKSNVYQVHMIVQSIQKARAVEHDVFDPETDQVTGSWRGSAVIERNIDPARVRPKPGSGIEPIPDYFQGRRGAIHNLPSMEEFYAYRILNVKQFDP